MCQLGPDLSYVLTLIIQGRIILTQYQKVRDQIDTFERSRTKLTHKLKVRDQIGNLPIILFDEYIEQKIIAGEIYIHTYI